ncbi:leucine-rich_repeat domain-containing protein [Hexamita inflata]|uniref:Leucine-rich repeat domain-containing protein n=1 Tax=Hexamita inflata TaxID=28002 RepID=A0AA86Q1V4_9EUKA|nr:leucine-rich repeat domain-containing protein [Hexamita inflata]
MSEKYNEKMISKLQNTITNQSLTISNNQSLTFLSFLEQFEVTQLILSDCYRIKFTQLPTNIINLVLSSCKLPDISGLSGMIWLKKLVIINNPFTNFPILQYLLNLTSLTITKSNIADFQYLKQLINLKELELSENKIIGISVLKYLSGLLKLDLSRNQIIEISSLKYLRKLTSLNLSYNRIYNFSAIQNLTSLSELQIHFNTISSVFYLRKLVNLIKLIASSCDLSDITYITSLTSLQYLDLRDNHINQVEPLVNMHSMEINLDYNFVEDYMSYSTLKKVSFVSQKYSEHLIFYNIRLKRVHRQIQDFELFTLKWNKFTQKVIKYKTKIERLIHKVQKHHNKCQHKIYWLFQTLLQENQSYLQ